MEAKIQSELATRRGEEYKVLPSSNDVGKTKKQNLLYKR